MADKVIGTGDFLAGATVVSVGFTQGIGLNNSTSPTAPALQFNSDTNCGIYQVVAGDNSFAISTGGIRAGYFDSNQNLCTRR